MGIKIVKRVRAPVRIDFSGGTTDISPFRGRYGGCVLDAALNRYIVGEMISSDKKVELKYEGDIPTSSGLGTSGVMSLVWLALISKNRNKLELAEGVYNLEQSIGQVGGKQDQYASAMGGINFIEFKKNKVNVHRLNLSKKFIKKLEDSLVLVYTGMPHYATSSNKAVIDDLIKGKNKKNLLKIKKITIKMKKALLKEDLMRFGELLNEETKERMKLHKSIAPPAIRKIIKEGLNSGALSAKICGSGGGGSILFFGNKKKLKKRFGKKVIDFKFDFEGLKYL
jgi:D-glycero-alpha-D-manno-heptose-7-phosphate kinase